MTLEYAEKRSSIECENGEKGEAVADSAPVDVSVIEVVVTVGVGSCAEEFQMPRNTTAAPFVRSRVPLTNEPVGPTGVPTGSVQVTVAEPVAGTV